MEDARFQSELRRIWDEVARRAPVTSRDLDPKLVDTIRGLHALRDVPPPDPAYAMRLRERLMHATAIPMPLADPLTRPVPEGQSTPPTRPAILLPLPRPRGRWAVAQLATAALLLLTLISSLLIFGLGRPWQPNVPAFLPAVGGTPEPVQSITTETMLDASTYALSDGPGIVVFKRLTLQPSPKPLVVLPLTGPVFVLVDSGELTATAARVEHQLEAGNTFSPAEPKQEVALRATGVETAVVYLVYLQTGPDLPFPRDPVLQTLEVLIDGSTDGLLGCPCRVQLERFTLPPGSALRPVPANRWSWFAIGEGVLGLTLEGERLPYLFKPGEERTFRPGQYLPIDLVPVDQPGTRMTIRNAGDDPLVLFRLTLIPGEMGVSGGATSRDGTPSG
jgi:hypothetical protein